MTISETGSIVETSLTVPFHKSKPIFRYLDKPQGRESVPAFGTQMTSHLLDLSEKSNVRKNCIVSLSGLAFVQPNTVRKYRHLLPLYCVASSSQAIGHLSIPMQIDPIIEAKLASQYMLGSTLFSFFFPQRC
jgi:hypothetical protein